MKTCALTLLLAALNVFGADLITCGGAQVRLFDPAKPNKPKWQWQASDSPSIPDDMHGRFRSTDECKPYAGDRLLITSSSGGVALINRETKKCLFLAQAPNAHSACLLPGNQLAVAASHGGDELQFYDVMDKRRPAAPRQKIPLPGAHGSVWDAKRNCLWALGTDDLLRIQTEAQGRWSVKQRWKLPSPGGHDLSVRDEVKLYATSSTQVLLFDRDQGLFTAHPSIGAHTKVKSVDRDPKTGGVVYHQGTKTTWWSDQIRFVDREPIRLPNARLYKVRWDLPMPVPGTRRSGR
ncbi:MAG: DUF6528 family protein [Limisphaerales bacterium]